MTAKLTLDVIRERCIVTDAGCWEYQGKNGNRFGYKHAGGWAHRRTYQMAVGPIPDGYEIDHLCFNPPCVNPAHLEAVTKQENNDRAFARRTHCGNGHARDEINTRWNSRGFRECRPCHRDREARRKAKVRAGEITLTVKAEQHGTATGYDYGCRCDECRTASRTKGQKWRAANPGYDARWKQNRKQKQAA